MRQIFTSQRLETVEGVARLLEEAGIGTYISHPRSYRSKRRGQFSYSEPVPANQQPAVWVRKPEDQPRARPDGGQHPVHVPALGGHGHRGQVQPRLDQGVQRMGIAGMLNHDPVAGPGRRPQQDGQEHPIEILDPWCGGGGSGALPCREHQRMCGQARLLDAAALGVEPAQGLGGQHIAPRLVGGQGLAPLALEA